MDATAFSALVLACAPAVHLGTAQAVTAVESSFNPYAIGVVGGALQRQPRTQAEAVATARHLLAQGWNFSLGLAQINVHNLDRLGLSLGTALDPCQNLRAMQTILVECFDRAASAPARSAPVAPTMSAQTALRRALSCYYSGNFSTGFAHGYVRRIARAMPAAPP